MADHELLPATWETPAVFRRRLGAKVGRQRAMVADGHLLLVLHAPPTASDDTRSARLFWRSPEGQWRSTEHGAGVAALEKHLQDFGKRLGELDEMDHQASTSEDYFRVLSELAPLLRATRNLHDVLQSARKSVPEDRDLINLRDASYELERSAELLSQDAKTTLDYTVARRAEEQAQSSHEMAVAAHRLNLLVALFFPIATLASVFGTNLDHTLEHRWAPWPFVVLSAVGLTLGMLLAASIGRWGRRRRS